MHEDQRSFKGIVDLFIGWVSHTLLSHLLPPQLQIVVPQLVAENTQSREREREREK